MELTKENVLQRLENLVRKSRMQHRDAADMDYHIYPPHSPAEPYIIEVTRGRFSRRVPVDGITVRRLLLGRPDAALMRDLRTAILAVARHSQHEEK